MANDKTEDPKKGAVRKDDKDPKEPTKGATSGGAQGSDTKSDARASHDPKIPPPKDDRDVLTRDELERRKRVAAKTEAANTAREAESVASGGGARFRVAHGKSLTTVRGVIDAGEDVSPLDFVRNRADKRHGEERIAELIEKGYVVPKPRK